MKYRKVDILVLSLRHDAIEWTFVIVGLSKREVESQCSKIEEKLERTVDARVMNVEREFV